VIATTIKVTHSQKEITSQSDAPNKRLPITRSINSNFFEWIEGHYRKVTFDNQCRQKSKIAEIKDCHFYALDLREGASRHRPLRPAALTFVSAQ
jgi:hypothetical protein